MELFDRFNIICKWQWNHAHLCDEIDESYATKNQPIIARKKRPRQMPMLLTGDYD
jgi:hypothetical protein